VRRPAAGEPWRVAFVGREVVFGACAQRVATRAVEPVFIDHRPRGDAGGMLEAVRAARPHAVVVFRPESVPPRLFAGLDALVLGWVTEDDAPPAPGTFDRLVGPRGWRSLPLPVDDAVFAEVRPIARPPRVLFLGESSEHREQWLVGSKHRFDLMHAAFGVHGERLLELFARTDIGVNLHMDEGGSGFDHRVALHLAAGHLLLSEPLSPLYGLEPGIDFLEMRAPSDVETAIAELMDGEPAVLPVQVRGRHKAEQFRASTVYLRLISDLADDVETFGTEREA
jgi:hypothetical protein